ncbi:MAG: ABC transporter ATP-binding protein [Acidimicrobiales bacterium]
MNSPIITGTGIVKRYGSNTVLDHTDIAVQPGVTGLLGANGAGKTTMLGLFLGLHRPDEGRLEVLGHDPRTAGPAMRARIGYSPEHHNLPVDLPANDFVQHIAEVHGMPTTDAIGRASDALWFVGMGEERTRPLGTLSTGQRQRVKLAMAIAHDPDLVMLDEPTDGLDPTQRETMLDLIRRLSSEFGMNVLLSSHLLDEVERTCANVVILKDGRVTASGGIDELKGVGQGLTIEVDRGAAELGDRLRGRGLNVNVEASRLVVTLGADLAHVTQDELFRVARDDVSDLQLPLRRLQNRTVSLEEVFLEVGT